MIEVDGSATNWINLRGPGLGHHPSTSIARHGKRWEIELNAEGFAIYTATARTRSGVIERLDELLDNAYLGNVEINRREIVHYMDRVIRFCDGAGW